MTAAAGRRAENTLAYIGAAQALLAGTLESLAHAGVRFGSCPPIPEHWWSHVPWFNVTILLVCVLPKTIGRMSAGKVWEALANKVSPRV